MDFIFWSFWDPTSCPEMPQDLFVKDICLWMECDSAWLRMCPPKPWFLRTKWRCCENLADFFANVGDLYLEALKSQLTEKKNQLPKECSTLEETSPIFQGLEGGAMAWGSDGGVSGSLQLACEVSRSTGSKRKKRCRSLMIELWISAAWLICNTRCLFDLGGPVIEIPDSLPRCDRFVLKCWSLLCDFAPSLLFLSRCLWLEACIKERIQGKKLAENHWDPDE